MSQTTAYLLTLAIEAPVVLVLAALLRLGPKSLAQRVVMVVSASTLTHPLLWLGKHSITNWPELLLAEGAVTLVEALIFVVAGGWGLRTGLLISLAANATSFGLGLWMIHTL